MNQWFRTNNPAMREEVFTQAPVTTGIGEMTLNGTIFKAGLLLAITFVTALVGYLMPNLALGMGCALIGLVAAITLCFKREWAMPLSLIYAPTKGYFLGVLSAWYAAEFAETAYKGLVPVAVAATFTVFGVMLALYLTRIIRVTETFRTIVWSATAGVAVFYLLCMVGGFIAPQFVQNLPVFGNGIIGIGFSIFVIVLAAANLATDFDLIESGVQSRAPSYMEWYGAFALLITLVWLYIEILRLLSKLARR